MSRSRGGAISTTTSGSTLTSRVFLYSAGQDPAGISYRLAKAINRHVPNWHADSMAVSPTYLRYPVDVPYNATQARRLYRNAHVVHIHQYVKPLRAWGYHRGDKGLVIHHHGTHYRDDPRRAHVEARRLGAHEVVSTLGLSIPYGAQWLPAPYEVDELLAFHQRLWRPSPVLRIAHAPTDRTIKSTEVLVRAVARLRARGHAVELRLIENTDWHGCLRLKAQCDVLVDQVLLEYGCNAIEAWGMGMPVVAGSADPAVLTLLRSTFGQLPFLEATEATLEDVLERLLDPAERRHWAEVGTHHVRTWHDARVVARASVQMYEALR